MMIDKLTVPRFMWKRKGITIDEVILLTGMPLLFPAFRIMQSALMFCILSLSRFEFSFGVQHCANFGKPRKAREFRRFDEINLADLIQVELRFLN